MMNQPRPIPRLYRPFALALIAVATGLFAAVLAPSAQALTPTGGGLYFQSAQPFSWRLGTATFSSSGDLWITANNDSAGQLVHSSDRGDSWQRVDPGLAYDSHIYGLTCLDVEHMRAVTNWRDSESGRYELGVLESDDGGQTWSTLPVAQSRSTYEVGEAFVSTKVAFIDVSQYDAATKTYRSSLLRTTDGGASWTKARIGCEYPTDLAANDARHLWLYDSDTSKVWTSKDAGTSWAKHTLPLKGATGKNWTVHALQVLSTKVAFVLVERGQKPHNLVIRTTDGGRSWKRIVASPDSTAVGFHAVSAKQLWLSVSGDSNTRDTSSYVAHTTNAGKSWTRHYMGARSLAVSAVGPDGTLYSIGDGFARSSDEGKSWQVLIGSDFDYWLGDVTATTDGVLWAAGWTTPASPGIYGDYDGKYGLLYRCGDGVTWKRQEIADGAVLACVDFADAGNGWAAGLKGRVLRTSDGGVTWSDVSAGSQLSIYEVEAISASTAVALAVDEDEGKYAILRTSDGGVTWSESLQASAKDELRCISQLSDGKLVIAGDRGGASKVGLLLESTDGGKSWSERVLSDCTRPVRDMTFTDASHGWILASDGSWSVVDATSYGSQLLRTTDGGATWSVIDLEAQSSGYLTLAFTDDEHGWLFGTKALTTSDGGATWSDSGAFLPSSALGSFFGEPVVRSAVTVGDNVWAVGADQLTLSNVDTAADTATPLTTDNGDRLWHNAAVTTRLTATDPGSGVAKIEYRVDGGSWQTLSGAAVTIAAPSDHSADGEHEIEYRSVDAAGNVELPQLCTVYVDTCRPKTVACGKVTARRGRTTKIAFKVSDATPNGGTATVRIAIRTKTDKLARRLLVGTRTVNKKATATFVCRLSVGRYTYEVTAVDKAGNKQASIGTGTLRVKR